MCMNCINWKNTTSIFQTIANTQDQVGTSLSIFVSVFTIKRSMGASVARARELVMVKILNKCILSILVYNLFFWTDRAIF